MKKLLLSSALLTLWATIPSFAQNAAECEKVVAVCVEAINTKNPELLHPHLAPEFVFSGQEAGVSKMVLDQLLRQLPEKVTEWTKREESSADGRLTLVYGFVFDTLGDRPATFVFDPQNRLVRLELFSIKTKTLAAGSTRVDKSAARMVTLPVEVSKNLPIVYATIEGQPHRFFFDSGSPRLILNKRYYAAEGTDTRSFSNAQGVNSSVSGMDIVHLREFDMGGIRVTDSDVLTMDMSNIEEGRGGEIHGIVGYELFKDYDLIFDYAAGTITLLDPAVTDGYISARYPRAAQERVAVEMRGHIPVLRGRVGETELLLGFDSGAGGNLMDTAVSARLGRRHVARMKRTELRGAGESRRVQSGRLREMAIGGRRFRRMVTAFNSMEHLNARQELRLDGLLGYELLSRGPVALSFGGGWMRFLD